MPKTPETPQQPVQTEVVTIEEMLARNKVQTVDKLPTPQTPAVQAKPSTDGAFAAQNGSILYRYTVGGETYILSRPIAEINTEDDFNRSVVEAPSPNKIPHDLYVKFKDPQWAGQWFNHKAGHGKRVSQARGLGFEPAKVEDLEWYADFLNDKDGALENGDLILMKIHKAKLYSLFKASMDDAKVKGGIMKYKEAAQGYMHQAGVGRIDPNKLDYYHTPQAEKEFQGLGPVSHYPTVSNRP